MKIDITSLQASYILLGLKLMACREHEIVVKLIENLESKMPEIIDEDLQKLDRQSGITKESFLRAHQKFIDFQYSLLGLEENT